MPAHATRHVEARLGTLTHFELAPRLGLAAEAAGSAIESGEYGTNPSMHPFADFDGRVCRLFLRWLLRRLDLPSVVMAPRPETSRAYLVDVRAADRRDWWHPLVEVWRVRLSEARVA